MTTEELHKAFLEDLSALLKKYDAELITEYRQEEYYGEPVTVIDFKSIHEGDNQRPYSYLDLPTYLN